MKTVNDLSGTLTKQSKGFEQRGNLRSRVRFCGEAGRHMLGLLNPQVVLDACRRQFSTKISETLLPDDPQGNFVHLDVLIDWYTDVEILLGAVIAGE